MAKMSKGKKGDKAMGTGKVTPVQIAFIVDRYLADNNFTNSLAAFRLEAGHLFSKTKGKEAPKGLLGLGDILAEYISLKEQRILVDNEKARVETALLGIQDVMRGYLSSGAAIAPSPPLLLPHMAAATLPEVSFFPSSNPSIESSPVNAGAVMNYAQSPMLYRAAEPNNFSTPRLMSSSAIKRKPSNSAPRVPPASKKFCIQQATPSSMMEGETQFSQTTPISTNAEQNAENHPVHQLPPNIDGTVKSPVQGSSVAKSLFNHRADSRANSTSPRTPPQPFHSQIDKSVSPQGDSSLHPSTISSGAVTGYYAVERSYHVTSSSPLKSSPKKLAKRELIKGRLHFDEPQPSTNLETSTNEESPATFDYELTDLDILNGEISFSELLAEIDRACEGTHSTCPGSELNADNGCLEMNQNFPGSCLPTRRVLSEKDMNIEEPDSMTSVTTTTTITKRIKIVSPAKSRGNCSSEQKYSPSKP